MGEEVPIVVDGARVLAVADIRTATPTGATKHIVGGQEATGFQGLAIATYEGQGGFYLFYCDDHWQVVTDTWHQTYEDALAQAAFEFGQVEFEGMTD